MLSAVTDHSTNLYGDLILNSETMPIKYSDTDTRNVKFREGLTQVTSAALNLQKITLADLIPTNSDIQFLNENLVNGIALFISTVAKEISIGFKALRSMAEMDYMTYTIFGSIGFSIFILAVFIILMYAKYNQ